MRNEIENSTFINLSSHSCSPDTLLPSNCNCTYFIVPQIERWSSNIRIGQRYPVFIFWVIFRRRKSYKLKSWMYSKFESKIIYQTGIHFCSPQNVRLSRGNHSLLPDSPVSLIALLIFNCDDNFSEALKIWEAYNVIGTSFYKIF